MKSRIQDLETEGDGNGNEVPSLEDEMASGGEDEGVDNDEEDGEEDEGDEDEDGNDDDDGISDQDEETDQSNKRKLVDQGGKKAKSAKVEGKDGGLYRPPTMDELNALRETQTLYHSNLFRLQMDEVLAEVSMKDKHRQQLDQWLVQLSAFLKSLPASSEYQLNNTKWMEEKGVCNPIVKSMPEARGTFLFAPPTNVEFVGSFVSSTTTTRNTTVDVMITLPKECVHAADWRNGRWLVKRTKYLAWLAVDLQEKTELVAGLNWTTHLGRTVRPVLQVTPSGGVGKKWKVNLFPVPPLQSFKATRFSPERSNLQPEWFFNKDEFKGKEHPPTPQYNWACAVDVVMPVHLSLIHNVVSQHLNLAQGIKLIKIWLSQRGLDKGEGCFSGHMVTLFVIHLLQTRKINPQMSAYQVFRNVVFALSSVDWTVKGPSMCSSPPDDGPSLEVIHCLYDVVFMDPSGVVNMASTLISADYLRVKHEAELALSFLDSSASDSFESIFIKKVERFQFSDQLLSIRLQEKDARQALEQRTAKYQEHTMDTMGDVRRLVWSSIIKTLGEGLGDRTLLLVPMRESPSVWPISQSPLKLQWSLVVGLVLNPTSSWALLTKGPPADDPEVEKFKTFWGEKCSLRRFQDGSFHEAVLWGEPKLSMGERRLIPGNICKYLLNRHYKVTEKNLHCIDKQLERILHHPHFGMDYEYATGEEATVSFIQAYDSLSGKLRSLDLPLKVAAVQSTSEVSRHTRVYPPLPKALQMSGRIVEACDDHLQFSGLAGLSRSFNYAMDIIVFLEISGKWPDDLEAIQAIKTEFQGKMCDLLKQDGVTAVLFPKFLQILWEGHFFRVRVCYLREIYLQRLVETPEGDWREQETRAATYLEKQIEIIPRYTTALASIQADHPSFSGGVRLCKRWVGSQLLLPHLPHIAVELLVAYLYLSPAPYMPPHTPHVAFLRFLHLLVHTDWKTTPFLVNLNEAFTVEDIAELNRRFISQRSSLPHMFLATPYELRAVSNTESSADLDRRYKLASTWTKNSPSVQITYRCKQLAEAALGHLNTTLLCNNVNTKMIFRPSPEDYDVSIRLKVKQLSRCEESFDQTSCTAMHITPYECSPDEIMPIVMFDAAHLYLKELRETFSHLALFFHDEHGGQFIGVIWKPQALEPQELKVGSLEGHQLVGVKTVKQVPNIEAILDDFRTMGAGLICRIIVKNK
ncbi:nucleolar protein 6-like [Homarus americanus]|uniref:Nucleolar protein 6 n=1 Tax=Homarus americanus TaxID=6706 RepID=A0A8J5JTH8_HOMAM|nr:nucleolar protein 6-like [Homarus americanus]KAG7161793.1 Nucleolar protein 6-like [Homarus americanus]